ncbi:hypothetical protein [Gordonia metallireducens]|uniref:hypothetical protein n=1 Tax=Gordonia metallireducens TaxID=2897779 RepID=UPI001E47A8D5|nr:hypothetical protein [Gordonia metallireducens]
MNRRHFRPLITAGTAVLLGLGVPFAAGGPAAFAAPGPDPDPGVAAPKATTAIRCEADSSGQQPPGDIYRGESASYLYDRRFTPGPILPKSVLAHHTPQAIAYWKNGGGNGKDLLLFSFHGADAQGGPRVVAMEADRSPGKPGRMVGSVAIGQRGAASKQTHAGGMAIANGKLFIDGPKDGDWHTIEHYSLEQLRTELAEPEGEITPEGVEPRKVYGASFMTSDGNKLYAGKFNENRRDWMYRYTVGLDGSLTTDRKSDGNGLRWEVPKGTQGVAKSGDTMFFSSSLGRKVRSNFYATKASETNLDRARARCFRAPSMSQGIAVDSAGGRLFLNYESGSSEFNGGHGAPARNIIPGPHMAPLNKVDGIPGGTLRLKTLHAEKQTDTKGDDEIAVSVEGSRIPFGDNSYLNIKQGQRKKIDKVVQFTGNARINLRELDKAPNKDDNLGTKKLTPGKKDGILEFTERGAVYRLSYTVS